MSQVRLYEINQAIMELLEMKDEIDEQAFKDTLQSLQMELADKLSNYAKAIKITEGDIETIEKEEKRLGEMKKTLKNKAKWLKETAEQTLILNDMKKLKTDLFSFNIQKNPPKAIIKDEKKIPEHYLSPQDPKIDKKQMLKDVKDGIVKEEDIGIVVQQTESLRIR